MWVPALLQVPQLFSMHLLFFLLKEWGDNSVSSSSSAQHRVCSLHAICISGDGITMDVSRITFHFVVGLLSIRRNRPHSRKIARIVMSKDIYPRNGWIVIHWREFYEAVGLVGCSGLVESYFFVVFRCCWFSNCETKILRLRFRDGNRRTKRSPLESESLYTRNFTGIDLLQSLRENGGRTDFEMGIH